MEGIVDFRWLFNEVRVVIHLKAHQPLEAKQDRASLAIVEITIDCFLARAPSFDDCRECIDRFLRESICSRQTDATDNRRARHVDAAAPRVDRTIVHWPPSNFPRTRERPSRSRVSRANR